MKPGCPNCGPRACGYYAPACCRAHLYWKAKDRRNDPETAEAVREVRAAGKVPFTRVNQRP